MKGNAVVTFVLAAGMALAELEGAIIVFIVCGFVVIVLVLCYH
jgi:hypothetical protein